MENNSRLEWADSIKEFKQRMALNSVFEDRHFHKVNKAYEHFEERFKQAGLQMPASADEVP